MSAPDLLAERYGRPAPWRRRLLVGASALLAAVFLGWLGWVTLVHGDPSVESDLVTWEHVDDHEVRASVLVRTEGDVEDVSCLLRAIAEDKVVVGEQSWNPAAGADERQQVSVRTERRATAVELVGCTAEGQSRPR